MAGDSKIEWTDATWNPIVGCSIVSPGCTNCYAMKMAARIQKINRTGGSNSHYVNHYDGTTQPSKVGPVWTGKVSMAPDKIFEAPLGWRAGRRIFVNSMGDLFHEGIEEYQIAMAFGVMTCATQHTYQVLTKRADRMRALLSSTSFWDQVNAFSEDYAMERSDALNRRTTDYRATSDDHDPEYPPSNVWLGISAERQQEADERIPHLLQTPAAIRFVSAEPLLGPIDLGRWLGQRSQDCVRLRRLDDQEGSDCVKECDRIIGAVNLPRAHGLPALAGSVVVPSDRAATHHGVEPIDQLGCGAVNAATNAGGHARFASPIDTALSVEQAGNVAPNSEACRNEDGCGQGSGAVQPQRDASANKLPADSAEAGAEPIGDGSDGLASFVGVNDGNGPINRSLEGHGHSPVGDYKSPHLDWLIVGGESGPRARPMHPQWARDIRDQCETAGVPFFFKQWGEWVSVSEVEGAGPHHSFPDGATVRRVGKKSAGRLLDGKEHNAFPNPQPSSLEATKHRSSEGETAAAVK